GANQVVWTNEGLGTVTLADGANLLAAMEADAAVSPAVTTASGTGAGSFIASLINAQEYFDTKWAAAFPNQAVLFPTTPPSTVPTNDCTGACAVNSFLSAIFASHASSPGTYYDMNLGVGWSATGN